MITLNVILHFCHKKDEQNIMSSQKPSIPKGTRDFNPQTMGKRNFILNTIKEVFKKFGFQQLETPAMENLAVLNGKYGEEGDQLMFKVLNNGDYLSKVKKISEENSKSLSFKISERALKYDLTVPFARFVVMNHHDLPMPFKRFQIQPVWRADRPQRGRYREFYQCDADVVGTDSLICEAEIIMMINEVFSKLKITDFDIKVNNRKILSGFAELLGAKEQETDLFVAIDKLDKIGIDKVLEELEGKNFDTSTFDTLKEILAISGSPSEVLATLTNLFNQSETGTKGVQELQEVLEYLSALGLKETNIKIDTTLARGLSYYTGAIFEVKVNNTPIGSVSGGGRYDDLTSLFGLKDMSGVGFSFGVDRLYDVMTELNLFDESAVETSDVLLTNFDKESELHGLGILSKLRDAGIKAEIYPTNDKMKKQFNFANKKNIPYVLAIGEDEIAIQKYTLKNMDSGEQNSYSIDEIIKTIS